MLKIFNVFQFITPPICWFINAMEKPHFLESIHMPLYNFIGRTQLAIYIFDEKDKLNDLIFDPVVIGLLLSS